MQQYICQQAKLSYFQHLIMPSYIAFDILNPPNNSTLNLNLTTRICRFNTEVHDAEHYLLGGKIDEL